MEIRNLITEAEVREMFKEKMTLQHGNPDLPLDVYIADDEQYHCVRDVVMGSFELYVVEEPQVTELMSFENAGQKYSNGYRSLCQTLMKFDRPAYARSGMLYVNPADLQYIYEQYSESLKEHIAESESPTE